MQGKLLIYGNDSMLLTTRCIILEKAGYDVVTTSTFAEAMLLLMNQPFNLLILCQSLTQEERRGMLESARAINSELKCAVLQFTGGHEKIANEETLDGLRGPTNLIESIHRMLEPGFATGSVAQVTEAN
jgi:DNA-binding response OmpR family regulator